MSKEITRAWIEELTEVRIAIALVQVVSAQASDAVMEQGQFFQALTEIGEYTRAMQRLAVAIRAATIQEQFDAAAVLASVPGWPCVPPPAG